MQPYQKPKQAAFCLYNGEMHRMQYTEDDSFTMQNEDTGEEITVFFDSVEFKECRFFKLVEF